MSELYKHSVTPEPNKVTVKSKINLEHTTEFLRSHTTFGEELSMIAEIKKNNERALALGLLKEFDLKEVLETIHIAYMCVPDKPELRDALFNARTILAKLSRGEFE